MDKILKNALAGVSAAFCLLSSSDAYSQPVNLVIRVKERVALQTLADNAQNYGITYTAEQIRDLAGPSDGDYAALISELKKQGYEIVNESKTHLFVTVRAEKEAVEATFKTKLEESGEKRLALMSATIPDSLSIVDSVIGLNKLNKRRSHLKTVAPSEAKGKTAQPGNLPATIKTAYGFDSIYASGTNGAGQEIAIATYDSIKVSDVTAYYKNIGLSPAPTVDTVNFNGTAQYNMDSAMETELDSEFSGMIAPGAAIHVYTSAENSDAGELALFTAILDNDRIKIVNYSWGSCETQVDPTHKSAMDSVFSQAVAQGVNVLIASGDSGSDGCGDGTEAADYPASNPNVIAVGGTTLVDSGGVFETAWSGSGGGVSKLYALPDYQSDFKSPYTMRSIPDVAFNADPKSGEAAWEYNDSDGTQSAKSPSWVLLGGTSIAAPQWSGFLALVASARAAKNLSPLGFVNPLIYRLSGNQLTSCFNDVTEGSNGPNGKGGFSAGKGWDAVTGLGSMKASALFEALTQ